MSGYSEDDRWEQLRDKIIGLGEKSGRKSYYPELQARLQELERFRMLMDASEEALFVLRLPTAEIIDVSGGACRQLGRRREELLGRGFAELVDPGDASSEEITAALARANGVFRTQLTRRDGDVLSGEVFLSSLGAGERLYAIAVVRDITRQLEFERALVEAKESAERTSRAKSEFITIASHELRTPLTTIRLLLGMWQRLRAAGRAPTADLLERLERQSRRLGEMLDNLLDISRLERGTLVLNIRRFELAQLLRQTIEDLRLMWPGRDIACALPAEAVWVDADQTRIGQVLGNLIDNALKYSSETSEVEVTLTVAERTARVSVQDRGAGIPRDEQPQLFQQFYRASSESTRHKPGLGLGLYVCREITALHHGRLYFSSEYGEGSIFYLELPLAPAAEGTAGPRQAAG